MSEFRRQEVEFERCIKKIKKKTNGKISENEFLTVFPEIVFFRYLSEIAESEENAELCAKNRGFFVNSDQSFSAILKKIQEKSFSTKDYTRAVLDLLGLAAGQKYDLFFRKIFEETFLRSVYEKTEILKDFFVSVNEIDVKFSDVCIDFLGISHCEALNLFDSRAKKNGEFFTPPSIADLIAQLATCSGDDFKKIYDPCSGSGSLILATLGKSKRKEEKGVFAQELSRVAHRLFLMNSVLFGLTCDENTIKNGDTLRNDLLGGEKFDLIVANPPFSIAFFDLEKYKDDPRFKNPGAFPPKNFSDWLFVEHIAQKMASNARAFVILPPGPLYRRQEEEKIRRFFVDNLNIVDSVFWINGGFFKGTPINTCILGLDTSRKPSDTKIFFCDTKDGEPSNRQKRELSSEKIKKIVEHYQKRDSIAGFCRAVEVAEVLRNGCDLTDPALVGFREVAKANTKELEAQLKDLKKREDESATAFFESLQRIKSESLAASIYDRKGIEKKKLASLTEIIKGRHYQAEPFGEIPVLGQSGAVLGYVKNPNVNKKCACLGTKGWPTSRFLHEPPFWADDHLFCFPGSEKIGVDFLLNFLKSVDFKKIKQQTVGLAGIDSSKIKNLEVFAPSLEEQEKINAVFAALDNLSGVLSGEMELLEKFKSELLREIFQE